MGRGVDIPWVGVYISWVGDRYTMYRGGQNTIGREIDIPWVVGVKIPCRGGRYTIGRVGQYIMGREGVDIP